MFQTGSYLPRTVKQNRTAPEQRWAGRSEQKKREKAKEKPRPRPKPPVQQEDEDYVTRGGFR